MSRQRKPRENQYKVNWERIEINYRQAHDQLLRISPFETQLEALKADDYEERPKIYIQYYLLRFFDPRSKENTSAFFN